MVFEDRELIFSFREPSAAPQNDQEAMKFLKKSGSSSYDPSVQVNMSHKYESWDNFISESSVILV